MRFIILLSLWACSLSVFAQVPPSGSDYRIGDGDVAIPYGTGKPEEVYRRGAGVYREGKKYGFSINNKQEPAIYDFIQSANDGFIVKKENQYAIADNTGTLVSPFAYDSVATNYSTLPGSFLLIKKGRYGIADKNGKLILPVKYDKILFFNKQLKYAIIEGKNNAFKLVNITTGNLLKQDFETVDLYKNLAVVKANGKMGVVKDDKMIIDGLYDSIFHTFNYRNSNQTTKINTALTYHNAWKTVRNLMVRQNGKLGITDTNGTLIYPCENDEILYTDNANDNNYYLIKKDKLFGLYLPAKQKKIPVIHTMVRQLRNGLIIAQKDGLFGMYDANGIATIPFEYEDITEYGERNYIVTKAGKKGLADAQGILKIPAIYDKLGNFYSFGFENYILAEQGKLNGVLSLDNKMIIPLKFAYIGTYNSDLFLVAATEKDALYGLYNKSGKELLPPAYKWIRKSYTEHSELQILKQQDGTLAFSNHHFDKLLEEPVVAYGYIENESGLLNPFNSAPQRLLFVKSTQGKFGLIEEGTGSMVVPMIYDSIMQRFSDGANTYFSVKKGKHYGLINQKNEQVLPFEYSGINLDFVFDFDRQKDKSSYSIVVAKGKRWGLVDLNNQVKIPFAYQALQRLSYYPLFKAKKENYFSIIDAHNKIINAGPFEEVAFYETDAYNEQKNALTFYQGKMRVIDDKGKFLSEPVAMQPHTGYRSFNELKMVLAEALDSKDDVLLKSFVDKIAPSEHLLFYLKTNMLSNRPLNEVNIPYIREKYFEVLKRFQHNYWRSDHYSKTSLTAEIDFTLSREGWVTNKRVADHAFGDTKYLEKMLRNSLKVNGYWISSYFMSRYMQD